MPRILSRDELIRSQKVHNFFIFSFKHAQVILLTLLIMTLVLMFYGHYINNELYATQLPLATFTGFIASYGAGYFLATVVSYIEIEERYEGYPYIAENIKLNLKLLGIKKETGTDNTTETRYTYGLKIEEIREGQIIRDDLKDFFDVYHFDVLYGKCDKTNFESVSVSIGNKVFTLIDKNGIDNDRCKFISISPKWIRLDIEIKMDNDEEMLQNIKIGRDITTKVIRKSKEGYILYIENGKLPTFKFGYLIVVPTEKITFSIDFSELTEEHNLWPRGAIYKQDRGWVKIRSSHRSPLKYKYRLKDDGKRLEIQIKRNPRLFVGEQLELEIQLSPKED
ncbi:hypothetical protein [Thermococcus sp. MAR1]|uniref:hypothetical protein n=1 Tax=Thermococcus sp. MAR1 TaxID=1638263 RepID=UPI00143C078D|nr:hypothetical protein [Thermococcus sp. MAR1]NJE11303.1 hypothetical protein [Thermococcus sp. MAR1]